MVQIGQLVKVLQLLTATDATFCLFGKVQKSREATSQEIVRRRTTEQMLLLICRGAIADAYSACLHFYHCLS